MTERWQVFLQYIGEISDLMTATAVLGWDQQTNMPSGAAETRANQVATLRRQAHRLMMRDEVGALLEELEAEVVGMPYDSFEASLLRVARREYEKVSRLPEDFVAEWARGTALAFGAWTRAKAARSFALFGPHLERLVTLERERADILGSGGSPYDAALANFEPDVTTEQVAVLFSQLRDSLVPLVAAIEKKQDLIDDAPLRQHFPEAQQWQLSLRALQLVGFDMKRGRLDRAEHPFTTRFSSRDVRITTNMKPTYFSSGLFSTMHEAGHALYEQGIPWSFHRTPLDNGATLSIHESQSLLWENLIGRSRLFWQHFLPVARELFPTQLAGVSLDRMYRAVNRVQPSPVRLEADEVTYDLHIFIRFELEQALITGALAVKDLPEAWSDKYQSYLGVRPPDDSVGVLQDVHWSNGLFGYFPTYTLGNILAAQLWQAMETVPGVYEQLEKGRFGALRQWLDDNVYVHGAKFTTQELAQRVTGSPLRIDPYVKYIRRKYTELYQL